MHTISSGRLQNPYNDLFSALENERTELRLAVRKKLIWCYSWAVPNAEALAALAELSRAAPIVELGAGTGYWAWLATQAGARITAYDREEHAAPRWFDVRKGTSDALAAHAGCVLLLCWPPLDEPLAHEALQAHTGEHVVYVGEPGRTADERFHDELAARFTLENEIRIPCWPGFNDRMRIYKKRSP